jgi:hypothetical protein
MKFIALAPMLSTQSALRDVAEVKDAVGFAEFADIGIPVMYYTMCSYARGGFAAKSG